MIKLASTLPEPNLHSLFFDYFAEQTKVEQSRAAAGILELANVRPEAFKAFLMSLSMEEKQRIGGILRSQSAPPPAPPQAQNKPVPAPP